MSTKLAIIGLGLHAEHAYLPLVRELERSGEAQLAVVVDLEARRGEVNARLRRAGLTPSHVILLGDAEAAAGELRRLDALVHTGAIQAAVISTDPRLHLRYLEWAAGHGLRVLVDKPISAHSMNFDDESAERLVRDFEALVKRFDDSAGDATVMVPRRRHPGIALVHRTLREAVEETGLPVTYLDLYHSSGYWNMPEEFLGRENHPYRHGYGALLHSGYHFVDLTAWMLCINERAWRVPWADRLELAVQHTTPEDIFAQEPEEFLRDVGMGRRGNEEISGTAASACGETDVQLSWSARRGARTISLGNLSVLETGLSHRAWRDLPVDTYKGNGKFAQDRITAHMGHLLSVRAQDEHGPDGGKSFVVEILRNRRLIGGDAVSRHEFEPPPKSAERLSVVGKRTLFLEWLRASAPEELQLKSHLLSVRLLAAAYVAMFRSRRAQPPLACVPLNTREGAAPWV
ncbi:Gfo/Idh/MocA family oxidoreductase [Streptomyces sp. NPDC006335]|uniref:Gfo/Idh/MocA family oxidoreductase n=1 Tax=Streptomyces sp. NPDC006335 TaxID=3156895 RepID=UPI0033BE9E98